MYICIEAVSYKLLSDAQMKAWENLAEHTTGQSVFGQKAQLSGINLYVRLNANRVMCLSLKNVDSQTASNNVYKLLIPSRSVLRQSD